MTTPDDRPRARTVSSREAYRNPWMVLREDVIERPHPDGVPRPGLYAVVMKPHSAVVVPFDGDVVHLVGQHRYPIDRWSWEFPQGAHHGEDDDQDHEAVARGELEEETGFVAGTMRRLGDLAFAPGMSDQLFTAWLATDLRAGEPTPDAEEEGMLRHRTVTPGELDAMVRGGEVVDAATVATWHLARPWIGDD
ncbi:NUDIX domain-containing protein [Patulibacter minatonensis]|uniref:NUDIX domain-containing protein n=1 Tax=Patulibacter minatonensis TaxID=298163 RepID=UPI00047A1209|nr:NUDIX hydrolase [Patulibacter minatonensis]